MAKRHDTPLSEEDRLALEQVVRKSADWLVRERAKTLLLCQPVLSRRVAKVQDLNTCVPCARTGSAGSGGMECLHGKPRSGAPRKLDQAAVDHLVQRACEEEPLTTAKLLQHPHSDLNQIEVMWSLMTHRWFAAKRRTEEELERAVEHVSKHFGSELKMDF